MGVLAMLTITMGSVAVWSACIVKLSCGFHFGYIPLKSWQRQPAFSCTILLAMEIIEQRIIHINQSLMTYTIKRSRRRRRSMSIGIAQDGGVSVNAPLRASYISIDRLILEHASWIMKKLAQRQNIKHSRLQKAGMIIPWYIISARNMH
jgi:hypothetical protein